VLANSGAITYYTTQIREIAPALHRKDLADPMGPAVSFSVVEDFYWLFPSEKPTCWMEISLLKAPRCPISRIRASIEQREAIIKGNVFPITKWREVNR